MHKAKWRDLIFWMGIAAASCPAALAAQTPGAGDPCFFETECGQDFFCNTSTTPDSTMLADAFDGDKLDKDWSVRGLLDQGSKTDWSLWQKTLTEQAGVWDASGSSATDRLGSLATRGQQTWSNYTVSAAMSAPASSEVGLVFYDDGAAFYLFSIDTGEGVARLMRCTGSNFKRLSGDVPLADATAGWWNFFHVSVTDSVIKASINGQLIFDVYDNEIPGGAVGAYTWGKAGAAFDDFHVQPAPAPIGLCAAVPPTCAHNGECAQDEVCSPHGECLAEVLDYRPLWKIYDGEASGVLGFVGGFDNLLKLFPAPKSMFTHSGLLGLPPVGHTSWDSVSMDEVITLSASPVSPDKIDGNALRQRLAACGITPFAKEALPAHPDPDVNALVHAMVDIGDWIVLGEMGQVWALVNLRGSQVTWIQGSVLDQEARTDGVAYTQAAPMTDLGYFLRNLNCNP